MPPAGEEDRAIRLRSNVGQRRVDDYSVIGGVLGAVSHLSWVWVGARRGEGAGEKS